MQRNFDRYIRIDKTPAHLEGHNTEEENKENEASPCMQSQEK